MNRVSAQTQMIIAGVVVVLIVVAALFLGILPTFEKASLADTRINELTGSIQTEQTVVDRRLSFKAQSAQTEVEMIRVAGEVPEAPDLPSLIINLQDTANDAGLEFAQISPESPSAIVGVDGVPVGYSSIPVSIKVQGKWADVIEYVRLLGKYTRGVRITTATMTYVSATEDVDAYVEANIKLEVYTMSVVNVSQSVPAVPSAPATPSADAQPSQ